MRTTLSISDELPAAAKRRAHTRGETLGAFVESALRRELSHEHDAVGRPSIPVFTEGTGPRPGVDLTSNRALYEVLDETVDPLQRR